MSRADRRLGLDRRITRRDFLDGVALGFGAALLGARSPASAAARPRATARYPPALTGLRGSQEGSYATAHALRDGGFWERAGPPHETGETYDLVVVGAGLSGLAGAYFFRQAAGPAARLLLLDNHDDFGGHARRNEFRVDGRLLIGYGGTFAVDSPARWSAVADKLTADLGVDLRRFDRHHARGLYAGLGLGPGVFFDRETFGSDRLLRAPALGGDDESGAADARTGETLESFLAQAPLSPAARRDLLRLYREPFDPLPGLDDQAKKRRLAGLSYADYLVNVAGCTRDVLPFFQARPHTLYGLGIDAVSAQDAWGLGLPGFAGLGLSPGAGPGMGLDVVPGPRSAFFHHPDGGATLARLLVRRLIPRALPGRRADSVLLARADYARLDEPGPARLRLDSTVVRVRHLGEPDHAREVEVLYVRDGRLERVRARQCLLACWSAMVPHLCAELPATQREALAYETKVPIVYTNVALRDWRAFARLGISAVHCPGAFHTSVNLDLPVSLGGYRCPRRPEEPILVHLVRTPCLPGRPAREQHAAGRFELLATSFADFERALRDQLARLLGPGGFDPARDIAGITVNRWPHGYAYQYNSLWDPFWVSGDEPPCVRARRPFGRLAIANTDTAAYAYMDAAFDQAWRAVGELLERR